MLGFESGKSGTVKYFSYIRADSVTSFWIPSMAICWMLSYACKICIYTTWGYYHQRICKTCWVLVSMTRCSEFQIESGTGSGYSWGLWIKTVTMTHIFFINKLSLFRLSDLLTSAPSVSPSYLFIFIFSSFDISPLCFLFLLLFYPF